MSPREAFTASAGSTGMPADDSNLYVHSFRPIRDGALSEILDEEFQRCYRFEGLSDLFHDLKGLIRKVVTRGEEESLELTHERENVPGTR